MRKLPDVSSYKAIKRRQRKELWFFGYYIVFVLDWLYQLCYTLDTEEAIKRVRLEKEARQKAGTQEYLRIRKRFAWLKF